MPITVLCSSYGVPGMAAPNGWLSCHSSRGTAGCQLCSETFVAHRLARTLDQHPLNTYRGSAGGQLMRSGRASCNLLDQQSSLEAPRTTACPRSVQFYRLSTDSPPDLLNH